MAGGHNSYDRNLLDMSAKGMACTECERCHEVWKGEVQ